MSAALTRPAFLDGGTRADAAAELVDKAVAPMTLGAVALYFCLSDMALTRFGVNYAEGGGGAIEKIHPGTWLAFAALLLSGARRGNPLRLIESIARYRGVALFLFSWLALLVWVVAVTKTPFTPLIDTFLSAIVLFLLIAELDARNLRALALIVHALMTLNAAIGVVEYATGWRLTPYTIGSAAVETDWRSTAILGHPLGNAALTGSYVVAMAVGGARDIAPRLRAPALALQLVAMIAFGGRSSLANALLILCGVGAWKLARILRGATFDRRAARLAFLAAPALVAMATAVAASGFLDLFIDRLSDDAGSGQTRLIMLQFFDIIPPRDILLGPDPAWVKSLQVQEGVELGIESFFVGFVLAHGALMAGMFFVGMFAFCWQIARRTLPGTWLTLMFYFVVASLSVSLSVKTIAFAIFVAMTLSIMRRGGEEYAA